MNIIDKLLRREKPDAAEPRMDCVYSEKSYELVDLSLKENRSDKVTYQGEGRTKYASGQPPQIYTAPLDAFNSYPVVRGVVTAISDAISSLGVKVYKVKGGEKVEDTKHDFHELFRNPNPQQGSQEFLEQICINLDLFGNCFIAIEPGGFPVELYILPTKYVAIIPDPNSKVKEYRYIINGQTIKYAPEEIIHIRYTDPDDSYYGASPLKAATKILELEKNRLAFASAFFANGAVPLGVLTTENVVSDTTLSKLRSEWTRLYQGVANSSKIAILQGGLEYKPIASALKDMDFKGLKEVSNADLLNIYRTPAIVLGDLSQAGGNEGKAALTAWWRNCLVPRIKRIEAAINRGLKDSVFGGGKAFFRFDLTDVAALQDDKEALQKYLTGLVSSSIMTGNEARAVVGLPKSSAQYMDEPLVANSYFGNQNMPLSEAANQGAGSTTAKPTAQPKKEIDFVLYDTAKKLRELTDYIKEID